MKTWKITTLLFAITVASSTPTIAFAHPHHNRHHHNTQSTTQQENKVIEKQFLQNIQKLGLKNIDDLKISDVKQAITDASVQTGVNHFGKYPVSEVTVVLDKIDETGLHSFRNVNDKTITRLKELVKQYNINVPAFINLDDVNMGNKSFRNNLHTIHSILQDELNKINKNPNNIIDHPSVIDNIVLNLLTG